MLATMTQVHISHVIAQTSHLETGKVIVLLYLSSLSFGDSLRLLIGHGIIKYRSIFATVIASSDREC